MQPAFEMETVDTPRARRMARQFLAANLLYLILVYVWGLGVHPMGRDYAILADLSVVAWPVRALLFIERGLFGGFAAGYHVVNLALFYGCLAALMHFTRYAVRGPVWLGSLAAALLMAQPVKTEAVLGVTGAVDLVPALFALLALSAYARHAERPSPRRYGMALAWFALAVQPFPGNCGVLLVLVLFEGLIVTPGRRTWARLTPFALITALCLALADGGPLRDLPNFRSAMTPLYFTFYPIGFLPRTAWYLIEHLLAWWAGLAAVLICACWIGKRAAHPAFTLGVAGLILFRLCQGRHSVDLTQMIGGGGLIVPIALFNVAFAAVCARILKHPKWPQIIVHGTTVLCLVLFAYQVRVNFHWRATGREVARFQQEAVAWAEAHPGKTLGVLPDVRAWAGAPVTLSEAIRYDTPFSRCVPHVSIRAMSWFDWKAPALCLRAWSAEGGEVSFTQPIRGHMLSGVYDPFIVEQPQEHVRLEILPEESGGSCMRLAAPISPARALPGFVLPCKPCEGAP